jgi:hypothetical protein
VKSIFARIGAVLNKPRVMHYLDIFVAAFAVELGFERDRILGAHGLNALGCVGVAAAVAGGKAVIEAYRKSFTPPTVPPAV